MRQPLRFEQFFWVSCAAHFLFVTLYKDFLIMLTFFLLQISIFMGDLWALHLIFRHCAKSTIWNLVKFVQHFASFFAYSFFFTEFLHFLSFFLRLCNPFRANELRKFNLLYGQTQQKFGQNRGVPNALLSAGSMHFILLPYNASRTAPAAARRPAARPG